MCESVESQERRVGRAAGTVPAACRVIALALALSALALFGIHGVDQRDPPGDATLTTNFFSHQTGFDELVEMLSMDQACPAANRSTAIDPVTSATVEKSAARSAMYGNLLREISVKDFRYFPCSGKLVLVPDFEENPGQPSSYYLYQRDLQPKSPVRHHEYDWRGPGKYVFTDDSPLKDSWFIHRDTTIEVALSPF